jgi:hypothetical protein
MIEILRKLYFKLFIKVKKLPEESSWSFHFRLDILRYYYKQLNGKLKKDEKEVLQYLVRNRVHYFPYSFISKYNHENIMVFNDTEKNMKYVLDGGKRLYFKKSWDENRIKNAYYFLLMEQDEESPHRYLTESFGIIEGDVVLDIGTAEGNFSLSIIEKVKKIFLFESDKEWIKALHATFEPWKEKVVITNKFVSDRTTEDSISLDGYIHEKIDFIKADVEGEELNLLHGAREIVKKYYPKVIMCTYHRGNDANIIKSWLEKFNYDIYFSNGYIIFLDDPKPPYLRKGLIRAEKPCH